MYKEIKKNLKESDNPVLDTFINKYKPLYDTKPVMRNNALVADQISFRGSGIPKRVEATYTPGSLKVENEEWGFFVYNGEVDTDSMDNMSQYWFYDDYMNREDFKAKIDKAAKDLYNDMSKLYETMTSNTEIQESEESTYSNKQGVCPKCGESNLEYESIRLEGEMAYFPYKCNNCGQEGEEWYSMEFAGHNVYDEEGNLIEL